MAYNVHVYKGGIKLGSGSATGGSRSIASYTGTAPKSGRNVTVVSTSGNKVGASINTRVVADAGATLTLYDAAPFS